MIWSSKTCNESLKFKPFQTCEDNYIYNKIDNNCIKCPDTYTYFDGNCINKSYITNDYNIITPSTDDINKDSVICNNDDKKIGDFLCKPNDIKPEIKNILDICPKNYIKYNLGCININ